MSWRRAPSPHSQSAYLIEQSLAYARDAARHAFRIAGLTPDADTLEAAARLELWAHGYSRSPSAPLAEKLLTSVYQGQLHGVVDDDDRLHLWAA